MGAALETTDERAGVGVDGRADGRRARRERTRSAVIDALFDLLQEHKAPPSTDLIAERSGVSVASIFRCFDGLDDLQLQTYHRFRERFAPLIAVTDEMAGWSFDRRVGQLVTARLDLYSRAGSIMMVGRLRGLEHQPFAEAATAMRGLLAAQVEALLTAEFAPPTRAGGPAGADLVAVVDGLTSLEAWDVMHRTHGRSAAQIADLWTRSVSALVDAWRTDPSNDPRTPDDQRGRR